MNTPDMTYKDKGICAVCKEEKDRRRIKISTPKGELTILMCYLCYIDFQSKVNHASVEILKEMIKVFNPSSRDVGAK